MYLAHYDKEREIEQLLSEHLNTVANLITKRVPPSVQFKNIPNKEIKKMGYWLGYLHDLGKYTDFFQDYLIKGKNSFHKNHAHISACFLYMFIHSDFVYLTDQMQKSIITFLAYLCVRLHHGALSLEGLFRISQEREKWETLNAIAKNLSNKSARILEDSKLSDKISLEQFNNYLQTDFLKGNKFFEYMPQFFSSGRIKDEQWFFLTIFMFSVLIDSDKLDSGGLNYKETKSVSPGQVVKYIQEKCRQSGAGVNTVIINRREKARNEMLEVIDKLKDEEIKTIRFYTLTAPTGIGKTLSSLQSALRLQERIKEVENYTPRIITAIPFINIIEQNKKEYENVFRDRLRIVVHHRLGDFSARTSTADQPIDKALLEVESWEGDVVLTTFVQLFQSIFTGNNRLLKKINKLAGSIVILDEAQAIPEKYMPLVGAVLQKIGEYWGTRFILMTATQPRILEFGNLLLNENDSSLSNAVPLLPESEEYFKGLKRTKLVPLLDKKINISEFISLFQEKWDGRKSVLVVVNTIKRSIEIYKELLKYLETNDYEVPVYYLSTNIIPLKRKEVIENVKKILEDKISVILVSTQTIEAGVDLDFDMCFRDFAPLDSLIQTAGRVNRVGEKGEYLPVYIIQLESDNHYVYKLTHRLSTQEILKKEKEFKEPQYGILAKEYYTLALGRGVDDISKGIWHEGILKLNFEKLNEFKMIENSEEVIDVFVEDGSAEATKLADIYEELLKFKQEFTYDLSPIFDQNKILNYGTKLSIFERKALLRLVLAKMSNYIIQIRASRLVNNRPIEFKTRGDVESSLYWIPPGQLNDYYNESTGFISESEDAFIF